MRKISSQAKIEILNVGWPPGIEGTGRLPVDADNVEISESGAGSAETAGRVRVGEGRVGDRALAQRLF
jgi:hypothetical protein